MTVLMFSGLFLIGLILLQRGRGGGLAGAFGGMGGQSAFGTKAGDVFTRITIGVAVAWILLCMGSVVALHNAGGGRIDASILKSEEKSSEMKKAEPLSGDVPPKASDAETAAEIKSPDGDAKKDETKPASEEPKKPDPQQEDAPKKEEAPKADEAAKPAEPVPPAVEKPAVEKQPEVKPEAAADGLEKKEVEQKPEVPAEKKPE